jgi:hypothetical protein
LGVLSFLATSLAFFASFAFSSLESLSAFASESAADSGLAFLAALFATAISLPPFSQTTSGTPDTLCE